MDHIVQFAIGIDDEAIKKHIKENAEKQIIDSMKHDIATAIFERESSYYNRDAVNYNSPQPWVRHKLKEFLEAHKDDIIREAAREFASHLSRTKKGKEILARYDEEGDE